MFVRKVSVNELRIIYGLSRLKLPQEWWSLVYRMDRSTHLFVNTLLSKENLTINTIIGGGRKRIRNDPPSVVSN